MSAVAFGDGREPGQGLRWTAAALLVAGVHVGAGWWFVGRSFLPPTPPEGVAGVTVDLEPVSVPVPPTADPKPMEEAGPGPTPQVSETPDAPPAPSEPTLPAEPPPPAEPPTASEPPAEAAVAPPPDPAPAVVQPKPDLDPPPVPTPVPAPVPDVVPPPAAAPSDAVLAPPPPPPKPIKKLATQKPPKPVAPKPVAPKPDPREVAREEARDAREQAREKARREARQEARAEAAAEARAERQAGRAQARAARAAAAREGGGSDSESAAPRASGMSRATWQGEVQARINAYKPASPDGSSGTVHVSFSIDRGGRIVSASVNGSSGDPQLDQAALSAVRRASPVPAPPPEMGGRVTIGVPIYFH